jgi:hypothetical protein
LFATRKRALPHGRAAACLKLRPPKQEAQAAAAKVRIEETPYTRPSVLPPCTRLVNYLKE